MDSSVSPKDEIWFLRVCHHISTGLYIFYSKDFINLLTLISQRCMVGPCWVSDIGRYALVIFLGSTSISNPWPKAYYPEYFVVFLIPVRQVWWKLKVKFSRYRPGVAQRVGRGIALLFHDHGTRRGWVVSSTPRPHFTPGKDSVPILQEAEWAPRAGLEGAENLVPTGIRSRTVQPVVSRYTNWATRPTDMCDIWPKYTPLSVQQPYRHLDIPRYTNCSFHI